VENILSETVLKFHDGKGYEKEATNVCVAINWRNAAGVK
jgi:hypothetical protein